MPDREHYSLGMADPRPTAAFALDPAVRRRLQARNPRAVGFDIAWTLLGLGLAFGTALGSGRWWGQLLGAFIAVAVQTRMAVLMHEAAHGLIAKTRPRNDAIANWLVVYPIGMTVARYRADHLPHHTGLGTSVDRDFTTLCVPPVETGLRASVIGVLTGARHFKLLLKYLGGSAADVVETSEEAASAAEPEAGGGGVGRALWQIALFGVCVWAAQPWTYFLVWLLPLLTVGVGINELRTIVEHTPILPEMSAGEARALTPITRTVRPGWFGRHWIGALYFHLHHEHHLFPAVPYSRLPELHRELVVHGYYDSHPELLCEGYGETLKRLWRRYEPKRARLRVSRAGDGGYVAHRE